MFRFWQLAHVVAEPAQQRCIRSGSFRRVRFRRWFQQICQAFTATMFKPVAITDGHNRNSGNRQEDSGNACEFRTRQNRNDDRERMKMNSLSDQFGIDVIVLNDA